MNHLRRNAGCYGSVLMVILLVVVAPLACLAGMNVVNLLDNPALQPFTTLLGLVGPQPTPTPTPPVVTIQGLRRVAELATVEYRTLVEITGERIPADFRQLFGAKEQILLLVYGDVKAGFDLGKLKDEDIWRDGTRVQLHLPAPEILSVSLDFKRTHVVHYEKSLIVSHDPTLQGETLQRATEAIRQAAVEAGILEQAREYGELFFKDYLHSLGFTEVYVITN